MSKSMQERVAKWHAKRKQDIHVPPGVKRKKRKRATPEPKEGIGISVNGKPTGRRIVLDATPYKLKRTEYP